MLPRFKKCRKCGYVHGEYSPKCKRYKKGRYMDIAKEESIDDSLNKVFKS